MVDINKENYLHYLIQYYDNPSCASIEEFYNDLNYFKYIKRLVIKYKNDKTFNMNILINHIITILNIFESSEKNSKINLATRVLFIKTPEDHWDILKTILLFLNRLPDIIVKDFQGNEIQIKNIKTNEKLLNYLNENF